MSQSQTASSTGRTALALGVVALIIGASALGYAVYLGLSQLPSQLSAITVNVPCSTSQPCEDNNGNDVACNTQRAASDPTGNCDNKLENPPISSAPPCNLWSTGYLGVVNTPGVYKFFCFYHQKVGMYGYITVLPNKGFTA